MANIYSNMTQKEKDNERAYLTNLQNSGNSGEKEWATNQLKQLNSTSSSSSTPSYNQTWESNGRTYVGGVDVGPAGTKVDTSNSSSLINAGIASNNKTNMGGMKAENITYNPYEEELNNVKQAYADYQKQIEEQNRLAVQQGTERLEAQKSTVNQAAEDNARQAYIMQMQAKKALPQQLAGQGVTGGTTETANLGIQTTYQNTLNDINRNKVNAIQEIDNAITDLKTTGDLATVEQVLANNQAMLDAYMNMLNQGVNYSQWVNQYNANRADTAYEQGYQERAYQDALKQQAFENELAIQSNNIKEQQANNKTTQTSSKTTQNNQQAEQQRIANNYYNLANQINKMYTSNTVGKNSGDNVIVNDGNGGYQINPSISRSSYLDLIIARALDSDMTDEEVNQFLLGLGISKEDISRVANYYLK